MDAVRRTPAGTGDVTSRGAGRTGTVAIVAANDGTVLRVNPCLRIPLEELEWRFSASSGPGGQHANTSNTRAEVRFDVLGSPSLGSVERERLLERLGPLVRVVASDERSQARNRDLALERLADRLASALEVETPRRPTRPTLASKRRRLDDKRRRAAQKRNRQSGRPDPGD
jgi:ribosome-associated protein